MLAQPAFVVHLFHMEVFLDGKRLAVQSPTLASALAEAADAARDAGRVIIEARGDGVILADDDLSNPSEKPEAFAQIHMVSADPRMLVKVTLGDAIDALRGLVDEQTRIAVLIQSDQLPEAVPALQGIFQTWQAVKDVVSRSVTLLGMNIDATRLGQGARASTLPEASGRLLSHLRRVKSTLEREDWSALADILEVDLCDEARAWESVLGSLEKHVTALPTPVIARGQVNVPGTS
jgi:hypothetical protein